MEFRRSFLITFILGGCLILGFVAGYYFHAQFDLWRDQFPILTQAFDILSDNGLKPLPEKPAMEYGMIHGMLEAYDDPYTIFVEPPQHELESNALQGHFGGIGVRLSRDVDGHVILYPFQGGPASEAGILEGDRLVYVDAFEITPEATMESIQAALRGPVGQSVRVTVSRPPDYGQLDFEIRRTEIKLPSVAWHLDADAPEVGVIEINLIAASTTQEVQSAIRDLQERGAQGFILDLRNNFGGLLTAGVDVARLFLRSGIIIEYENRDKKTEIYRVEHPGPYVDLPLAVIVNENTASASEIIAGALKAHHRAQVIGTRTYGKNTIQLVFDLKDGSSLHVTSAQWRIPGLDPPIGEGGLEPDIYSETTPDPSGVDAAIRDASGVLLRSK